MVLAPACTTRLTKGRHVSRNAWCCPMSWYRCAFCTNTFTSVRVMLVAASLLLFLWCVSDAGCLLWGASSRGCGVGDRTDDVSSVLLSTWMAASGLPVFPYILAN